MIQRILLTVVILLALAVISGTLWSPGTGNPLTPSAAVAASDGYDWEWVTGSSMFYGYPSSLPTFYVVMNHPGFYVQCKDMQFKFDDSHYSFVTAGYWDIYNPLHGTFQGSKIFVLSNGWFKGKLDQLEDVFNPARYRAQCKFY